VFSNLFSITLPNIGKYFPGIHFPRNSLSKKKLLSCKQTGPNTKSHLRVIKKEKKKDPKAQFEVRHIGQYPLNPSSVKQKNHRILFRQLTNTNKQRGSSSTSCTDTDLEEQINGGWPTSRQRDVLDSNTSSLSYVHVSPFKRPRFSNLPYG